MVRSFSLSNNKDCIISPQIDPMLSCCVPIICTRQNKKKKCLQLNMLCNLHLQLSQCTRIANLNTELAGFCRSRFMHSHFHCGQLKEIAKRRSSGMQFELKCHMPLLTWLYYLTSNFQIRRVCKRRGLPTILIPCTFPVLTLNGSLFLIF